MLPYDTFTTISYCILGITIQDMAPQFATNRAIGDSEYTTTFLGEVSDTFLNSPLCFYFFPLFLLYFSNYIEIFQHFEVSICRVERNWLVILYYSTGLYTRYIM